MIYLLSFLHALICLLVFIFLFRLIKRRGLSMLTLGFSAFFFVSTLGLVFSYYIDYGAALSFADADSMVVRKGIESVYLRQVVSHWLFLVVFIASVLVSRKRFVFRLRRVGLLSPFGWQIALVVIFLAAYIRYFFLGPGFDALLSTKLIYFSAEDAVNARSLIKENFYGQGVYMASVAAYIILPVLFSLYLLNSRKRGGVKEGWGYALVFFTGFFLSLIYAFQTRQKAPIIQIFLIYALLHALRNSGMNSVEKKGNIGYFRVLIGGLFLFFLTAILYVLVFNMGFAESVYASVVRIFMVPSATEANYFYVFPDIFAYRGFLDSFVIRIFYPPGVSGISIYDVAVAATGNQFASNASFLAIGWSGFGYFGVIMVSITLCSSLVLIDWLSFGKSKFFRNISLALSFPPFLILNSGSFLDFVGAGGIILPILLMLAAGNASRS